MIKNKTVAMTFGKRLKGLMKKRGITNAELADVVGVSEKLVERWCEGLSEPRIDKFVFHCEIVWCSHGLYVRRG